MSGDGAAAAPWLPPGWRPVDPLTRHARRARMAAILVICGLFLASCGSTVLPAARPLDALLSPGFTSSHVALTTPGASSGCSDTPIVPVGTSAYQRMTSDGQQRSYRLHVPSGYKRAIATPLVLAFHGDGSDGGSLEAHTGLSSLADAQGFLVAYPDGLPTAYGFTGWGGLGRNMPAVNDVQFVGDLIDQLSLNYCVNPSRIYATGFSRGGGMTALLACQLSNRIAAFAPVSGSFFSSVERGCAPSRPVPILDFHGSADTVAPYAGGGSEDFLSVSAWLAGWVARDGCAAGPQAIPAPSGVAAEAWISCAGGSSVMGYRVLDAGHAWPGGSGGPRQINAASVIWSFFQAYSLPRGS